MRGPKVPLLQTRNYLVGDVRRGDRHATLGRGDDEPTCFEHATQREGDRQTFLDHQVGSADRLGRDVTYHVIQTGTREPLGANVENV
eukprot:7345394-Pyramimonas_sp.AAC.1